MKRSELVKLLNVMPDVEVFVSEDICGGWVAATSVEVDVNSRSIRIYNHEQTATVILDDDGTE